MSLFSENLSEQEEKIASLERANFDLKMQVFYLNKKIADGAGVGEDGNQDAINQNVIEDRSVDILALREELDYGKRRIEELESELLQLQLIRDNEAIEYQKLLHNQPTSDISLLEESRRREREVAKTIAEHDAALIAQLRQEIDSLQLQHDRDVSLVEDCTARLAKQMEVFEVTSGDLSRVREENNELHGKITVLTDTARQQEQLLTEANSNRIDPHLHELLRRENTQLKEQIERQKTSIANQAEALSRLGVSAAQESQEMIRLATELDVCCTARDEATLARQKLAYENDVLRVQLYELKSLHALGQPELSPGAFQRTLLGSSAVVDAKLADAYKKREAELLAALEGVIQRCRELEEAQHRYECERERAQQEQPFRPFPPNVGLGAAASAVSATAPPRRAINTPGGARSVPGVSGGGRISQEKQQEQDIAMDKGRAKSADRRRSRAWH